MPRIHTYLTFSGNCREALSFYKSCLNAELHLQTIGESPLSEKMPDKMKDCILHGMLKAKDFVIMGSDMVDDKGLRPGNNMSLMLDCESEEEIGRLFNALSDGGNVQHALERTYWGAMIGDFTDKYGNKWLLHFNKNESHGTG